jgi:Lon protease-like protein
VVRFITRAPVVRFSESHNSSMHRWLPLFPLRVVLLPAAELPLHIFEDRYKEMIGAALRDKTEFGIVLANEKGIVNTGCTAAVERVLREYADGRLDILVVGRRRFELLEIDDQLAYLRGSVEYFDDDDASAPEEDARARAIAGYNEWRALSADAPLPDADARDPRLSFRLAGAIEDLPFRQTLLAARSEAERLRQLAGFFPAFVGRQRRIQHVKQVAPRNGHGKTPKI